MTTAIEVVPTAPAPLTASAMTPEHIALIRSHIMQSVSRPPTPEEFQLFLATCQRTGLDPLLRQVYCIERGSMRDGKWHSKYEAQLSIDGMRLVAERTGRYQGQVGPLWCGADGVWFDVWPAPAPPVAAKVGVWRAGFREPLWATAHYTEYVQTRKDGGPTQFWQRMPALMLAKCAESQALRKAFPHELSGIYTREESGAVEEDGPPARIPERPMVTQLRGLVQEARALGLDLTTLALGRPADMSDADLQAALTAVQALLDAEQAEAA